MSAKAEYMNQSRAISFAIAVREELQITGSADLASIAKQLRLEVRELDLNGCDGALIKAVNNALGIIAVRRSIREIGRKRFTIAHEIGHHVLHGAAAVCDASEIGNWSSSVAKNHEKEADEFAAELLLPSGEIVSAVNSKPPSLDVIRHLAEQYEASLSASAWRYCDVIALPCAIVWSTKQVIQWSRRSDSFEFFLRHGAKVPSASYAMASYRGHELPQQPEPVAAHEWLESSRLVNGAEIWEHSLNLPFYESVLTLLWVKRDVAKKESAEDSLLPELDPQEFTLRRKRWPGKR